MADNHSFNIIYIGGPTAIFEIGGFRFMTDPTLDPAGETYHSGELIHKKTKGPATTDLGSIDFVLLSHDQHYDNLDNAGRVFLQTVPKVFTTMMGAEHLKGPCQGLTSWQTETLVSPEGVIIDITATPARHGPAGSESLQGEVIGFLLSVRGKQGFEIYITGDTVYYEGVAEVARRYHPKYVFAFAGAAQPRGLFDVTMRTNDVIDTALVFPNAMIIPLHFEGWAHLTQNENDILQAFRLLKIDQRLRILEAGKVTALE